MNEVYDMTVNIGWGIILVFAITMLGVVIYSLIKGGPEDNDWS